DVARAQGLCASSRVGDALEYPRHRGVRRARVRVSLGHRARVEVVRELHQAARAGLARRAHQEVEREPWDLVVIREAVREHGGQVLRARAETGKELRVAARATA